MQQKPCTAALLEQLTTFGGGFSSIKKDRKKKTQHGNVAAREAGERKSTLTAKMCRSPATFSVHVLSDLAKTSSLHVNEGYFRPRLGGLPHLPRVNRHLHVNTFM